MEPSREISEGDLERACKSARKHRKHIGRVYAGRDGIIGALTEDLIDTSKESRQAIAALRHTPGGAFGDNVRALGGHLDGIGHLVQRHHDRSVEVSHERPHRLQH